MMMAAQIPNSTTNQLAGGESINHLSDKKIDNMDKPGDVSDDQPLPATGRRRSSGRRRQAAGNSLSNSLRVGRRGGLEMTQGRLSVSFSDQKGLSKAQIGDILCGGGGFLDEEGKDEPEKSMAELLGVDDDEDDEDDNKQGGRNLTSSMNKRMQLLTIQSQRSVTFCVDPKDLLESDEEE